MIDLTTTKTIQISLINELNNKKINLPLNHPKMIESCHRLPIKRWTQDHGVLVNLLHLVKQAEVNNKRLVSNIIK